MNAEVSAERRDRDGGHETESVTIALGGFILSVFFILWALIVLVRFYVFDNVFYNLFLFCLLTIGKNIQRRLIKVSLESRLTLIKALLGAGNLFKNLENYRDCFQRGIAKPVAN